MPGLLLPGILQPLLPLGLRIIGNEGLLVGHEFFHPLATVGPRKGQVDDDPRPVGILQQLKPLAQDAALVFGVLGPSCRVAQGVVEKDLPRVAGAGGNVPGVGVGYRGDAPCFQHTGDQTHGLVTDGSDRRQQGHIHMVLPALPEDLRSVHFGGFAVAVVRQGPVVVPAQTSEHPFLEKLLQSRDGKIGIHIPHVRLVTVVVLTGGEDAVGGPVAGRREHLQLIGADHPGFFQGKSPLIQQHEGCGCHQRHPAFGEGLVQRGEGDILVVGVVVSLVVTQMAVIFMGFFDVANVVHHGPPRLKDCPPYPMATPRSINPILYSMAKIRIAVSLSPASKKVVLYAKVIKYLSNGLINNVIYGLWLMIKRGYGRQNVGAHVRGHGHESEMPFM